MSIGVGKLNDSLEDNEEYWPERIIAQQTIAYDVEMVRDILREISGEEPTLDDVIERIHEYVKDDFSCGWGHEAKLKDILIFDPDGEEY
jgi:hypothetical protein